MKKVPPSKSMNKALFELLDGETRTENMLSELMLRGAQQVIQQGLEGEVTEFLGRRRYERAEDPDEHRGFRNGHRSKRFKTAEGTLEIQKPRVRDTEEPFVSQILAHLGGMEERLKKMVIEMYVRGLSTRDIEETLVDQDGEPLVSRSTVSRICEQLHEEYEVFCEKDLSNLDVVYLFVDGVYEAVRDYTNNQAILCAWGICADGTKQMLHLGCVASESRDAWSAFFEEMIDRGLGQPLLVISDGAKGLIAAIQEHFPQSDRQRCLAHKLRNLTTKLPRDPELRDPVLKEIKAIYYAPNREVGDLLAERFIDTYAKEYPAVVKCLSDDLEACLVHLKYPQGHHQAFDSRVLHDRNQVINT